MSKLIDMLKMTPSQQPDNTLESLQGSQQRFLMLASRGIMLLILFFLLWSLVAEVDEVAIAVGSVVPQEQLKLIQHLEGGIVEEINIEEGDLVKANQILMKLNLGAGGVNRNEKKAELDSLLLTRTRLQGEVDNTEPVFAEALASRQPGIVKAELAAYIGRREEHNQSLAVRKQLIKQRKLEVAELNAKSQALKRDLVIQKQQADVSNDLLKQGLTSKVEHLQVMEEYEESRGEVAILKQALPRARAALQQARLEEQEIEQQFKRRALDELAQVERNISRLTELLSKADDQLLRTSIRSPIDGVVKRLQHSTLGGVIRPGEVIMEIVPVTNNLVIEAKLSPVDRGYVKAGQKVMVKVTTYDYARYGGLDGKVSRIGADSQKDPDSGLDYFEVVAKTDKTYLGKTSDEFRITPGMEATVEIHTGSRSIMSYMIEPVLKIKNEAFRER